MSTGEPIVQEVSGIKYEASTILNQTNNETNVREMVERLYPERQTTSRFSLKNPNARFTQTHDMLRQTIKNF